MRKNPKVPHPELQVSRVLRSKRVAQKSYDRLSRWYNLLTSPDQRITRLGLNWLALQPGEQALDLGCGTGIAMHELACMTDGKAGLSGCDLSLGMLARARSKLHREGAQVSLICADAVQLPYLTRFFDAVLLSFTLDLIDTPEIPLVLAECRRILKADGRLVVISLAKTYQPGLMELMYEWLHARLESIVDCRPIFTLQFIEQAGFNVLRGMRKNIWGLPVDIILAGSPSEEGK